MSGTPAGTAAAFYSENDRCWYVPVSAEMWQQAVADELKPVEPARVELKDGQLWITQLAWSDA